MALVSEPVLSSRLAVVAALCPEAARLADVGSDHGLLPLALLASGRASRAIATERTRELADRIARPPAGACWEGRFAVRFGDGLAPLEAEDGLDAIVVAGLGGRSIVRILSAGSRLPLLGPGALILQPRSEPALVRAWLSASGWALAAERLTGERGRRHLTLLAERGDDTLLYRDPQLTRDDLLAAGPLLVRSRDAEVVQAWRETRDRLRAIASSGRGAREELSRAERVLARLRAA